MHKVKRCIQDINVLIDQVEDFDVIYRESELSISEVTKFINELEFVSNKVGSDCSGLRNSVESCVVKLRQKVLNTKAKSLSYDTLQTNSLNQSDLTSATIPENFEKSPPTLESGQPPQSNLTSQSSNPNLPSSESHPQSSPHRTQDDTEDRVIVHERLPTGVIEEQSVHSKPTKSKQVSEGLNGSNDRQQVTDQLNTSFTSNSVSLSITQAYNRGTPASNNQVNTPFLIGNKPMDSHFKKASAPVFGGERKLWPEFKTIFPSYCNANFHSEEDRAWGLKNC